MSMRKVNLLIIGQTPPPYVGQMLSIENLVKAEYPDIRITHVRMNYSRATGEIGKFRVRKLFHLIRVIFESVYKIYRHRIDVIYYPPGADTVPLLRDIVTLLVLRRTGRKLILVFHASGLSETVSKWKGVLFRLFKSAFYYPDAAIQKSPLNPPDGAFVRARSIYTVPNGWPDQFERFRDGRAPNDAPVILFVGLVREDKGVGVLVEAARLLKARGRKFLVRVVGEFTSEEYRRRIVRECEEGGVSDCVEFCGRRLDDEKWALYRDADIFCFPSFYPSESFGNVLVEAMMFEMPVVSTNWRGIPDVVEDGETGFLVEVKNAPAIARRLEELLDDAGLRARMARKGRQRYLDNFTVEKYLDKTREVVLEVAAGGSGACATDSRERKDVRVGVA